MEEIYNILTGIFYNVIPDYDGDESFPYPCDFYCQEDDMYIDFIKEYDKEKEDYAKKNHIRYCAFLSEEEFYDFINASIEVNFTEDELRKEYKDLLKAKGSLKIAVSRNKIVRTFQFYNLYQKEIELFSDFYVRYKLFRNRKKYINVEYKDLNPTRILNGFKISGIHYGYSMFNPMLAKWFVENYHLENTTCYDPTGGWGHRLLGIAPYVKKYIYNDLSEHTVEGCKNIAKFFELTNVDFHNEDAKTFNPDEDYDFMFTCPPYYENNRDLEEYECDGFNSQKDYHDFIMSLYDKFINKDSCKMFGLVIKDNMLPDEIKTKAIETYCLTKQSRTHFNRTEKVNWKNNYEYLYVFKK